MISVAATGYASLLALADRMWEAARGPGELGGDLAASEWTAQRYRGLIRDDLSDDPSKVGDMAEALEAQLHQV